MSSASLQFQIALKQYTDTITKITAFLAKKKDVAPRVLHMLESGMLNEDDEKDLDRLSLSVNKIRLLSLENLRTIVRALGEKHLIPPEHFNAFNLIKTKTEAVKVICFWMGALDTSALPSKLIAKMIEWSETQARNNQDLINKTVFCDNMKLGRHAGKLGYVNTLGCFSYSKLEGGATGIFKWMKHNKSGVEVLLDEIAPSE